MLKVTERKDFNMRKLSRETKINYLMLRRVLINLQGQKIINRVFDQEDKNGKRDYIIKLTPKGKLILNKLIEIEDIIIKQ